ncbi:MAG: DUF4097 family beta strand repeat protein [Clostridia bacterium]|nr:DUF4097 family beta strand repeat protein [Clostridia bacterium]
MTTFQKVIKYLAIALAIFLTVTIIGGILSAIGWLGGFFTDDLLTQDMQTYSVSEEIRNLDIQVGAADLNIQEGEVFSVKSNLKNLKVEQANGRLTIKDSTKLQFFGLNASEDAVLTIYLPAQTIFESVNITTGAGRLTVDALSAQRLNFELGAGEVSIGTLVAAQSANVEGGAGRITIAGGSLHNADMDMGVGELNLTSALGGDCELNMGIGNSNITLIGNKEDYKLELEKGIGSISVDGKDVSDFGSSGNGTNKVDINGGIGSINVRFEAA